MKRINVCSIEIIVCLPILHLVFQATQLSAGQYGKRIMVGMKFPMQHQQNHDKNGEKTANETEKDGKQTKT